MSVPILRADGKGRGAIDHGVEKLGQMITLEDEVSWDVSTHTWRSLTT